MLDLFVMGGPFMWLLLLLGLTVVVLTLRDAVALATGKGLQRLRAAHGSGPILFWGCLAAVLGLLGTLTGMYKSLTVIRQAGVVDPKLVALGISVALITLIFGLLVMGGAALAWFVLRWWLRRVEDGQHGASIAAGT